MTTVTYHRGTDLITLTTSDTYEAIELAISDVERGLQAPRQPRTPILNTSNEAHQFALELTNYENEVIAYQAKRKERDAKVVELKALWREKLRDEYGNWNDDTFGTAYEFARDDTRTYRELRDKMEDITDLIDRIIFANKNTFRAD